MPVSQPICEPVEDKPVELVKVHEDDEVVSDHQCQRGVLLTARPASLQPNCVSASVAYGFWWRLGDFPSWRSPTSPSPPLVAASGRAAGWRRRLHHRQADRPGQCRTGTRASAACGLRTAWLARCSRASWGCLAAAEGPAAFGAPTHSRNLIHYSCTPARTLMATDEQAYLRTDSHKSFR
jgi:hypothetical protein